MMVDIGLNADIRIKYLIYSYIAHGWYQECSKFLVVLSVDRRSLRCYFVGNFNSFYSRVGVTKCGELVLSKEVHSWEMT